MKKIFNLLKYSIIFYISLNSKILANWSLKKGTSQIISQLVFLNNQDYNTLSTNPLLGEKYSMKSSSYMLYGEYGINPTITIGFSTMLSRYDLTNTIKDQDSRYYAVDWLELFTRKQIFSTKNTSLSTQINIKIPGIYNNTTNIYELSSKQNDYEARIEFGIGMPNNNRQYFGYYDAENNFLLLSIGYRHRENMDFNVLSQRIYYGHKLSDSYMMLFKFERYNLIFYKSFTDTLPDSLASQYNTNFDFSFSKNGMNRLTASLVARISHDSSFEFGIIQDIYETGFLKSTQSYNSNGIIIGYWKKFQ